MPKVSVIIPVFNTEKYLRKCLDSVCNQTLSDIEIICIDDCSTDDSLNILKEYALKDNRIKLIEFKENKGVSVARNTGISEACGEYIGFVDSDDFIDLDFYEKLYSVATNNNADCAKGNIYNYCNGELELTSFYDINDKIKSNKIEFLYGFTSAVYKTNYIKQNKIYFPNYLTHFEDPYFSIISAICINKVEIVNDAKYYYVKHNDSACSNCKTYKKTCDFIESSLLICKYINNSNIDKKNYLLIFNFILQSLIPWCSDLSLSEESNIVAINGLHKILEISKYSLLETLEFYFLNKKRLLKISQDKQMKLLIQKLRKRINNK